jgi:hypothetical protein
VRWAPPPLRALRYPRDVIDRAADPRTEDTIVYDVLRTPRGASEPEVIGRAVFRGGRASIDAPDEVRIAISEQLERSFVDRVQADERPRGYRRSGVGMVDLLVPGMPEHFIARMRGLWLSYPDGSVVTAREAIDEATGRRATGTSAFLPDHVEPGPPVTNPEVRRSTLARADSAVGGRPLVRAHPPDAGVRPKPMIVGEGPLRRTDCGWIV